jgi:two-component sensor histidine kinase
VQFDEVISKIIQSAVELSTRPNEITISKEGEFGAIPSLVATPLALVITELVHNALEHGVSETGSVVRVSVTREGSMMTTSVIDDGTGIPSDFSLEKNTNLGLQIVHTLTLNELAGEIEFIKPSTGTEVRITFPISR